jgi:DNA-binding response OmpR family regulator
MGSLTLPKAPRRVLVVDDDLDYVHTMAWLVRAMGFEADFAINATRPRSRAALSAAHCPARLGLPDGDGRKLARPLRLEPGLDGVRIYCVSARAHEDRRRSLEAGCDDHFVKPLEPRFLASLLGAA